MIKFEKNKLIIEIETNEPIEQFIEIQKSLMDLLQSAPPDTGNNSIDTTLSLLKSMILGESQIKDTILINNK